jgi:hypothetical protein
MYEIRQEMMMYPRSRFQNRQIGLNSVDTISEIGRAVRLGALAMLMLSSPTFALDVSDFDGQGVTLTKEKYRSREAIRVVETKAADGTVETIAILKGPLFHNGTVEVWLAGEPSDEAAAADGARGFVGIAFRVADDPSRYEAIYLRPTNGRAEDQLRRNHAIQYISHPEYPWKRLRDETPGKYESYSDMAPGEWIRCRIVVSGSQARLFLGSADQPSLVVNDLKQGDQSGRIALWIGPGTVAHFSDLRWRP